jgi:hypothetical protein
MSTARDHVLLTRQAVALATRTPEMLIVISTSTLTPTVKDAAATPSATAHRAVANSITDIVTTVTTISPTETLATQRPQAKGSGSSRTHTSSLLIALAKQPTSIPPATATVSPTATPTFTPAELPTPRSTELPTPTSTELPTVTPTERPTSTSTELPTVMPIESTTSTPIELPTSVDALEFAPVSAGTSANTIRFELGATSATVGGYVDYDQPVRYVLHARAGQPMTVALQNQSNYLARVDISTEDGIAMGSAYVGERWSDVLPATQNYYLTIRAPAGVMGHDFSLWVEILP